jgi:hypothetical protein
MASEASAELVEAQTSAALNVRSVAIIDDAFIPPALGRVPPEIQEAITQLLATDEAIIELDNLGIDRSGGSDAILDALTDPARAPSFVVAELTRISTEMGRMIEERHSVRRLVALIEEQVGTTVTQCSPEDELPDLRSCDLVLIDYYLEGSSGTGDRAKEIARQVRRQHRGPADQQVVLMSSIESVRQHRAEFREEADLAGAAFAFVSKSDMDERWKVKAHLGMLERARPHAPVLAAYRDNLAASLQQATQGLLRLADDLDIGDYAYLQSQALMNDGHPLGDYVSWLLSSHLTTLAFEGDDMRASQRAVDRLEFENRTFASTEPSQLVARLFHSALLSSNLGPVGPHPRAKTGSRYDAFPLVQLGDVFLDAAHTKAIVVLSADCDLAFSPLEERPPNGDTPVILVPGEPKALILKGEADAPAIEGIMRGDQVYRIDWSFSGYRSVPLGQLHSWLVNEGYDTTNRDRLRPLYGLKLQQEFGAHLLRVGPPVMPPLTYAAEGRIYIVNGGQREMVEDFTNGEVMLSHHKGVTVVRMTPKLVDAMRRSATDLLEQLIHSKAERPAKQGKIDGEQLKIDALRRDIENDDYWIMLVDGVPLNALDSVLDKGSACSFVHGSEWQNPGKPRVVLEIVEKAAVPI